MATVRKKQVTAKKTISETAKAAGKAVVGFTLGAAVAPIAGVAAPVVGTVHAVKKAVRSFDNKEWVAVDKDTGKRVKISKGKAKKTTKK